jgi:hypothetical protein
MNNIAPIELETPFPFDSDRRATSVDMLKPVFPKKK